MSDFLPYFHQMCGGECTTAEALLVVALAIFIGAVINGILS
jgi:hypothetical protein